MNPGAFIEIEIDDFQPFPKIPRLSRDIVITEKLDGTNAQICIEADEPVELLPGIIDNGYRIRAGSRNRWLTTDDDNHGFAKWVSDHAEELIAGLGVGRHYGEWWGKSINRGYGLEEKRFSLFNTGRWVEGSPVMMPRLGEKQQYAPACCHVVPVLYRGNFQTSAAEFVADKLRFYGSVAAPGFMKPEGLVVYHTQANMMFKKTLEGDEKQKGAA